MSPQIESVMHAAMALPPEARALLVDKLLESLDQDDPDPVEISEAWAAELRQRVKNLDEGKTKAIPVEEVFRKLDERFQ